MNFEAKRDTKSRKKCASESQNGAQIDEQFVQNGSRWQLGATWAAGTEKEVTIKHHKAVFGSILGAKWEPNSSQMESKRRSKKHQNLKSILRCIFDEKGAKMEPTWEPKWSKNGAKIASRTVGNEKS